MFLMVVVF